MYPLPRPGSARHCAANSGARYRQIASLHVARVMVKRGLTRTRSADSLRRIMEGPSRRCRLNGLGCRPLLILELHNA